MLSCRAQRRSRELSKPSCLKYLICKSSAIHFLYLLYLNQVELNVLLRWVGSLSPSCWATKSSSFNHFIINVQMHRLGECCWLWMFIKATRWVLTRTKMSIVKQSCSASALSLLQLRKVSLIWSAQTTWFVSIECLRSNRLEQTWDETSAWLWVH